MLHFLTKLKMGCRLENCRLTEAHAAGFSGKNRLHGVYMGL